MKAVDLIRGDGNISQDVKADLELDTLIENIIHESPDSGYVSTLLSGSLQNIDDILFRQDIYQDLFSSPQVREDLSKFVSIIRGIYQNLGSIRGWYDPLQDIPRFDKDMSKEVDLFRQSISDLEEVLSETKSKGLRDLKDYASRLKNSEAFKALYQDKAAYIAAFAAVRLNFRRGIRWRSSSSLQRWAGHRVTMDDIQKRFSIFVEQRNLIDIADQLSSYLKIVSYLSHLTKNGAVLCRPQILDKEQRRAKIVEARNPLLYHTKPIVVPNDIVYGPSQNFIFVSGPNQGGKTTYTKTEGLLTAMALSGSYILAREAEISDVDRIFTHFVRPDDITKGEGRCLNEARRMDYILRHATPYSLVVVDEPSGSTSHNEGVEVSKKVWIDNLFSINCCVWYTTHMYELPHHYGGMQGIVNLQVEIDLENSNPRYTHNIKPGIGERSFAMELLTSEGLGPDHMSTIVKNRVEKGEIPKDFFRRVT